jgi:integrase
MENEVKIYEEEKVSRRKSELKPTDHKTQNWYDEHDIKYFYQPELHKLLNGINDSYYMMAFLFIYEVGARVSEVLPIRFRDFDTTTGNIKVPVLKQRKKKIFKMVTVSDKMKAIILNHRIENKLGENDFILAKAPGKNPPNRSTFYRNFRKYVLSVLGAHFEDKAHPHTLRHSRAVHMLQSGINIAHVKSMMAHKSIANTMIYLQYSNRDFTNAVQQANREIGLE